jgi:hypothetical protein
MTGDEGAAHGSMTGSGGSSCKKDINGFQTRIDEMPV